MSWQGKWIAFDMADGSRWALPVAVVSEAAGGPFTKIEDLVAWVRMALVWTREMTEKAKMIRPAREPEPHDFDEALIDSRIDLVDPPHQRELHAAE